MSIQPFRRAVHLPLILVIATLAGFSRNAVAQQTVAGESIIRKIERPSDRLEMIVKSSRMLTLEKRIPKALVNNPDIVELYPRSANQLQIVAKNTGFTQVNIWDEDDRIYTIDVFVTGDARELAAHLKQQFPRASLKVVPIADSVIINGSVDNPAHVQTIITMAEGFYPQVINRVTVGGVQQVLLRVKVMEVSRTKLRRLGFDFAHFTNDGFAVSSVSGLITAFAQATQTATGGAGANFNFGVIGDNSAFFGVIEALRQDNLLKILAEPDLVTVSGRPSFFNVGGEFPILVPGGLGTVSVEYNGNIRLEVRPRISEVDNTRSITINNTTVPGLRVREVDTAVELRAGQTLAIAGLVQTRIESQTRGIPWISELPWIGALFRRVEHQENEIELIITVTPELVDALDPHEVPCGPGGGTTVPCDVELFWKAYKEVPRCCPPGYLQGPVSPLQYMQPGQPIPGELPPPQPNASDAPGAPPTIGPAPSPSAQRRNVGPAPRRAAAPPSPQGDVRRLARPVRVGARPPVYQAMSHRRYDRSPATNDPRIRANQARPTPFPARNPQQPRPGFIGPTGYDVSK